MSEKNRGFYQKYEVKKLSNPEKKIDCVVLEFDDPIARVGIRAWALAMIEQGYYWVGRDVLRKIGEYKREAERTTATGGKRAREALKGWEG